MTELYLTLTLWITCLIISITYARVVISRKNNCSRRCLCKCQGNITQLTNNIAVVNGRIVTATLSQTENIEAPKSVPAANLMPEPMPEFEPEPVAEPKPANILNDEMIKQIMAECTDVRIEYMRSSESNSCWLYSRNNNIAMQLNRNDCLEFFSRNKIKYAVKDYYPRYYKYLIVVHLKGNARHSTNIALELPQISNAENLDAIQELLNSGRLTIKPIRFHSVGTKYKVFGECMARI
jgi:hypothetical protein